MLSVTQAQRPMMRRPRPPVLPVSYAQQRLWFLDRLEAPTTTYNLTDALRLRGRLDRDALQQSLTTILARHESLRTRFTEVDGEPRQIIAPPAEIPLPI